jgi:DNA-binding response OmpR family regulator
LADEKVLVVEDTQAIRDGLLLALSEAGYETRAADNGRDALKEFYEFQPDLVLLDLMLPAMNGAEVCKRIRSASDTPVIILSAVDDEAQKVHALTIGADDYVVKGAGIGELLARIKAALRRARLRRSTRPASHYADTLLEIDFAKQAVAVSGRSVELTPIEFRLLSELVRHEGRPLSSVELLTAVWGPDYEADSLVKWHISRLRRKLSKAMGRPEMDMIVTRRGYGYAYFEQAAA